MADLTAQELIDFRADIGDRNNAFTVDELQRLYVRSEYSYKGAVSMAYRQLMANAVKFADYTSGESQEKKSQIFANLARMADYWKAQADDEKAPNEAFRITGIRPLRRSKADPYA